MEKVPRNYLDLNIVQNVRVSVGVPQEFEMAVGYREDSVNDVGFC